MAQGAAYKASSEEIKWYYLVSNDKPTLPADLAAADTIAADANLFAHTRGDPVVPAVNAGAAAAPFRTVREHGADQVVYKRDIKQEPAADETTFDLAWNADMTNTLHRAILTADTDTYAVIIADIQTDAGDGTRGVASGNAEGTMICCTVQHADAPITLPAGADFVNATTTFTVVEDAAGAKGRVSFHYGEP